MDQNWLIRIYFLIIYVYYILNRIIRICNFILSSWKVWTNFIFSLSLKSINILILESFFLSLIKWDLLSTNNTLYIYIYIYFLPLSYFINYALKFVSTRMLTLTIEIASGSKCHSGTIFHTWNSKNITMIN